MQAITRKRQTPRQIQVDHRSAPENAITAAKIARIKNVTAHESIPALIGLNHAKQGIHFF
jgi:hypothetical protein